MSMKKQLLILFVIIFSFVFFVGCEANLSENKEGNSPLPTNNFDEVNPISPETHHAADKWEDSYSELKQLLQVNEFNKITLVNEGGYYQPEMISWEEPDLINMLAEILTTINGEVYGDVFDLKETYFILEDGKNQYKIQVGSHAQIAFPEWYGTQVFGINHSLVTIVDALLKRPSYVPEAPFEERLWDTGLLYYQEGQYSGYMTQLHRTKLVAQHFLQAEKELITDPGSNHGNLPDFILRLYSHGGTIELHFFKEPQHVLVKDSDQDTWYRMSLESIQQLAFIITGS